MQCHVEHLHEVNCITQHVSNFFSLVHEEQCVATVFAEDFIN